MNLINKLLRALFGRVLVRVSEGQYVYNFWFVATNPECGNRFFSSILLILPSHYESYPFRRVEDQIELQTGFTQVGLVYRAKLVA